MIITTPFGFSIDFSFWQTFFTLPFSTQVAELFALGAWVILAYYFIKTAADFWADFRQSKGTANWEYVVLAVDIPALFIQTPKAVEQIFAHLTGAAGHADVAGKFWHGHKQKNFSFEIISLEGYIQFLVRTEKEYRDLIEAAIYAQYTEAEITEVEDYVDAIPDVYPNGDYDVMGVEFKMAQPEVYPIRMYKEFEYNLSKDAVFSDPMAAVLENFSRIGHGENLWMQMIVEPTGSGWKEKGIETAKEIMKGGGGHGHGHGGGGLPDMFLGVFSAVGQELVNIWNWSFAAHEHEEHKEEKPEVTPGMKKTVEAIEEKISKVGFKTKIRLLYAAKRGSFSPNRCIEGFIGAMNQFHMQDRNAIVPYMTTHAHYDSKHTKSNALKNTFVKTFKKRKMKWKFQDGYVMNIEELATVWHFPLPFVKTPLLSKSGHKRAEPPTGLPVESTEGPLRRKVSPATPPPADAPKEEPPEELPYG